MSFRGKRLKNGAGRLTKIGVRKKRQGEERENGGGRLIMDFETEFQDTQGKDERNTESSGRLESRFGSYRASSLGGEQRRAAELQFLIADSGAPGQLVSGGRAAVGGLN